MTYVTNGQDLLDSAVLHSISILRGNLERTAIPHPLMKSLYVLVSFLCELRLGYSADRDTYRNTHRPITQMGS